jgi:hypothetical protein
MGKQIIMFNRKFHIPNGIGIAQSITDYATWRTDSKFEFDSRHDQKSLSSSIPASQAGWEAQLAGANL